MNQKAISEQIKAYAAGYHKRKREASESVNEEFERLWEQVKGDLSPLLPPAAVDSIKVTCRIFWNQSALEFAKRFGDKLKEVEE